MTDRLLHLNTIILNGAIAYLKMIREKTYNFLLIDKSLVRVCKNHQLKTYSRFGTCDFDRFDARKAYDAFK